MSALEGQEKIKFNRDANSLFCKAGDIYVQVSSKAKFSFGDQQERIY
jgi:hypothetical protein